MNRKGMSMISLVVIIIVTLILVGIATTAGYRYITQVNKVRAQALQTAIGNAAYRRQNDVTSGVSDRYYDGYMFNIKEADFSLIENLPEEDFYGADGSYGSDGIPDYLQIEGSMWYLFDAESATNLGADKAEGFLTRNLSYYSGPDVSAEEKNELLKLVLADYATGEAYYVRMPAWVALDAIGDSIADCPNSPTGKHKFTIATCTEPSVCIYCGLLNHEALGHLWIPPTCTEAGKCQRCGIIDPDHPALGHLMISNDDIDNAELIAELAASDSYMIENLDDPTKAWVADANKHWHQCIRCGIKQSEDPHDRYFVSKDERTHQELCSICGWQSVVSLHKIQYESVTDNTHRVWCEACLFGHEISGSGIVIHDDSGWLPDNPVFHYRICEHMSTDYCNNLEIDKDSGTIEVIFKEAHYDHNEDYLCDVCGRNIDTTPPPDFGYEDFNSYVRVVGTTTSTITLEAYTDDQETNVVYYNFGILNGTTGVIEWSENVLVANPTDPAQYTFTGLDSDKEYTFYVRATDTTGNQNNPYEIKARTSCFPEFNNIRGVPENFVKGPYNIGVVPVETDLPGISLIYKQNDGEWGNRTPIENMDSIEIPLSKEREVLYFKFVDEKGNESQVWTYTVECIDDTPPSVTITPKLDDNNTSSALYHQATITISDIRAGIDKDTIVRYGWSTSSTTPPSEENLNAIRTPNLEVASAVSFDVVTPEGLNGDFYLWVMRGVEDAVGNATIDDVVSGMHFTIDDEQPRLTNIKMLDVTPSYEVPEEVLFVKTDGEVTVTFTSDKLLRVDPIVRINGVDMTSIEHVGMNYTCKIRIDNTFDEGTLQLFIGDVMSINGRVSDITYSNDDIVTGQGPVYYDKTLPVLDNIKKKTVINPINNGGEIDFQVSDGG